MKNQKRSRESVLPKSLRCYAKKEEDHYFACCIDMCLGEQGDTIEEAMSNLKKLVVDYIELAVPDLQPGEQLFRSAPFSFVLEYHYIWLACKAMRCRHRIGENCSTNSKHQVFSCRTPALA